MRRQKANIMYIKLHSIVSTCNLYAKKFSVDGVNGQTRIFVTNFTKASNVYLLNLHVWSKNNKSFFLYWSKGTDSDND